MDFLSLLPATIKNKVMQNVLLAPFTSFKIGGPAKYFVNLCQAEEIIATIRMAKKISLPYKAIGEGSNILVSDKGFDGVVIKISGGTIKVIKNKMNIPAGISLSQAVQQAATRGLSGLEFAMGIPGSLGGAIWGNAGAFQHLIGDFVDLVEIIDQNQKCQRLSQKQCQFSYRESIFKTKQNQDIIVNVTLNLKPDEKQQIKARMTDYLSRRPKYKWPSAGSIFLNPTVPYSSAKLRQYDLDPKMVLPNGKIPAGYLIDQLDFKGKQIGGAMVSPIHANCIINVKNATAEDVIILIGLIKQKVRNSFSIQLQEEIQYLGF